MGSGSADLRRYVAVAAQLLITLSLLFALVFLFDWKRIGETIGSVRVDFLFGAAVCLVVIVVLGALNIWILLNAITKMSFKSTLYVYLMSWCTFLIVPGSAGDAIQLLFLRQAGVPYRDSGIVYFTDKVISLAVAIFVGVVGGLIYFRPFLRLSVFLGIATLMGLIGAAAYKLGQSSRNVWILRLQSLASAPGLYYKNHSNRVRMNILGTSLKLAITGLSHWLTFHAIGAEVNFGVVITVAVLAGLVAYVPIAFNGLGTVEFAAMTLYRVSNVPDYQVLATYVILRTGNFLAAAIGLLLSRLLTSNPSALLTQR